MKNMRQLTAAYNGKVLQELRTLYLTLRQAGRTMEEFLEYMDGLDLQRRQVRLRMQEMAADYREKAKQCPRCRSVMYCYEVNTNNRNQLEGGWKSQWICPKCEYDVLSLNTVKEEFELLGLGGKENV